MFISKKHSLLRILSFGSSILAGLSGLFLFIIAMISTGNTDIEKLMGAWFFLLLSHTDR